MRHESVSVWQSMIQRHEEKLRGLHFPCISIYYLFLWVRWLAFQLPVRYQCNYPETWTESSLAGCDWFTGFMKRQPCLSIRLHNSLVCHGTPTLTDTMCPSFLTTWPKCWINTNLKPKTYGIRMKLSKIQNMLLPDVVTDTATSGERERQTLLHVQPKHWGTWFHPCLYSCLFTLRTISSGMTHLDAFERRIHRDGCWRIISFSSPNTFNAKQRPQWTPKSPWNLMTIPPIFL